MPVFLLDEHQVVRPGELGTVEDIEGHASKLGLAVRKISLDDQFRCGGSEAYMRVGAPPAGARAGRAAAVARRSRPSPSRWPTRRRSWSTCCGPSSTRATGRGWRPDSAGRGARPRPDGSLVPDVVIGDWSRPWNLRSERSVGGAPPSALWATDPAGFGQVGCVYTAQGFEYDWNGVIMGPDLVWRDGGWIAGRDASRDPDLRSRRR